MTIEDKTEMARHAHTFDDNLGTPPKTFLSPHHGSPFMESQIPLFLNRFSLSYFKDARCIEYFLYSNEKTDEISKELIVSHDIFSNEINVSKFYPEIYKETLPRYMSATCFFLMMHHAASLFDIHCDCSICLETRSAVFESFYKRLKDFDFIIQRQHVCDNCHVQGCYHDFPVEIGMIKEMSVTQRTEMLEW